MKLTKVQSRRSVRGLGGGLVMAAVAAGLASPASASPLTRLPMDARLVGDVAAGSSVSFALTLPVRDQQGLNDFLTRLYDPADPLYHQFITPAEFAERFGPTLADYQQLKALAAAQGLSVTQEFASRLVLDVTGPAQAAESMFGVRLRSYRDSLGRSYHIPDRAAVIPADLQALNAAVVGLDNAPAGYPHYRVNSSAAPSVSGSPIGMNPAQIHTAYNVPNMDGSGQSIALMELDSYTPGDIARYRNQYGINGSPLVNIYVDGASSRPGQGAIEVTLDIDMILAIAGNASAIHVYQAPNNGAGPLDCYAKIANDNQDKTVSTSWGLDEIESTQGGNAELNAESAIFQQMATQGQSIFAAAGDSGAFDDLNSTSTVCVDDPASQPFVTGVGGTTLTLSGVGAYVKEAVWNDGPGDAGGGGVSRVWSLPLYQKQAGVSGGFRQVPDVSLNADPNTAYAIYLSDPDSGNGWYQVGGTSAAAPLWAAYTSLVNQQLASSSLKPIGFLNESIYPLCATPSAYALSFHDITTGNNRFYAAGAGFDEATGWGSFNASSLTTALAGGVGGVGGGGGGGGGTTGGGGGGTGGGPVGTGGGGLPQFSAGVQMIALPADYTGTPLSSVFNQPVSLFWWNPVSLTYVTSPVAPADTIHQMDAYWVNFATTTNVLIPGTDLTFGKPSYSVMLQTGWNMVGNPYGFTVPMTNVTVSDVNNVTHMGLDAADAAGYVYANLYSYDPTAHAYSSNVDGSLTAETGYWIKAFQPCILSVAHP